MRNQRVQRRVGLAGNVEKCTPPEDWRYIKIARCRRPAGSCSSLQDGHAGTFIRQHDRIVWPRVNRSFGLRAAQGWKTYRDDLYQAAWDAIYEAVRGNEGFGSDCEAWLERLPCSCFTDNVGLLDVGTRKLDPLLEARVRDRLRNYTRTEQRRGYGREVPKAFEDFDPPDARRRVDVSVHHRHGIALLEAWYQNLEPAHQKAFSLFVERVPSAEAAVQCDVSTTTYDKRVSRLKADLKKYFKKHGYEP